MQGMHACTSRAGPSTFPPFPLTPLPSYCAAREHFQRLIEGTSQEGAIEPHCSRPDQTYYLQPQPHCIRVIFPIRFKTEFDASVGKTFLQVGGTAIAPKRCPGRCLDSYLLLRKGLCPTLFPLCCFCCHRSSLRWAGYPY